MATTKNLLLAVLMSLPVFCYAGDDYAKLDSMLAEVRSRINPQLQTVTIEHSRLAAKEGEMLSPSVALIFSDPVINTAILEENPLTGLDLPFKLLFYTDKSGHDAVTYTSSAFIAKRHNFTNQGLLKKFDSELAGVIGDLNKDMIRPLNLARLNYASAVLKHESAYDFATTLQRFKDEVLGNNEDTLWFGEIDFTADAAKLGIALPKMKLLMFGAPAPGAKAMNEFKTLGLDAFCQKVLLLEQNGKATLYSNDIQQLARLHYNDNNLSHRVINFRLGRAYSKITEK